MPTTIKQLLNNASQKIDRLDAEVLLAHVLDKPREFFISHDTDSVNIVNKWKFKRLVKKRAQHYPAAQLIGTKGFFGLDFFVNTHTLIPRPDTELIVELALEHLSTTALQHDNTKTPTHVMLIDVGTGSGCIPIAIAKQSSDFGLQTAFYASDISKQALRVAKRNSDRHNTDITFKKGNLLTPLLTELHTKSGVRSPKSIIITANLPYLTEHQFQTEPSIQHEPKSALVADNEGLALYEELLQQLVDCRLSSVVCFFEIDPTQSSAITPLIKMYFPNATVEIKKDLAGLDRIVCIRILS